MVVIQNLVLKQFYEEIPLLFSTGGVGLCLASVRSYKMIYFKNRLVSLTYSPPIPDDADT